MKSILLILSRLSLYYQKNKPVFLMFCIGGIASTIGFLYFYGNTLPLILARNDRSIGYREYTVHFPDRTYTAGEILELLGEEKLLEGASLRRDPSSVPTRTDSSPVKVQATVFGTPHSVLLMGDDTFAQDDLYSALVPAGSALRVGEDVSLHGHSFKVTGKHDSGDFYIIPLEAFKALGLSGSDMTVYSAEREMGAKDRVHALLAEIFPHAEITTPAIWNTREAAYSLSAGLQLTVGYGIVMLAFLFLFLHMMEENAKMTAVCRIVGASNVTIGVMHFWEIFCLSTGCSLVGILLHAALYKPFFSKINLARDVVYRFGDYVIALLLTMAAVLLISIPFVIKGMRCSPVEAYRRTSQ